MLCKACLRIFEFPIVDQQKEETAISIIHHRTTQDFYSSACDHCQVCRHIWQKIFNFNPEELLQNDTRLSSVHLNTQATVFRVEVLGKLKNLKFCIQTDRHGSFSFDILKDGDGENEYRPSKYTPSTSNTGSNECIGIIRRWINTCRQNHNFSATGTHGKHQWYPTRLIDVKAKRLVLSASAKLDGPYTTLSHRWNEYTPKYLNLNNLKRGIEFDKLPQVFQDAIALTTRLGCQYLWIDTMCIIQDGEAKIKDWEIEASLMGKIYANGYCNILANGIIPSTKSKSGPSNLGMYRNRNTLDVETSKINILDHPPTSFSQGYLLPGQYSLLHLYDWEVPLLEGQLMRRGWVFQERILSPRLLHFGEQQVFWECNELRACESHPEGLQLPVYHQKLHLPILKKALFDNFDGRRLSPTSTPLNQRVPRIERHLMRGYINNTFLQPYGSWFEMIQGYTSCLLTFETDILVAMSGVASLYSLSLDVDDRYLAGIWSNSLPWGLLWRIEFQNQNFKTIKDGYATPQETSQAPSWSWASTNNMTVMSKFELFYRPCVAINESNCYCSPLSVGVGKFGAVSGGRLFLRGRLTSAQRFPSHPDPYGLSIHGQPEEATLWWRMDRSDADPPIEILCLPLVESHPEAPMYASKSSHGVMGITLARIRQGENVYYRTGWFTQMKGRNSTWPNFPEEEDIIII